MSSLKEIVDFFCTLDIPLLPCHGIIDGKCTCKRGATCPSPGKHPLFAKWQLIASTDPKKVLSWFGGKKPVNLALSTGRKSSVSGKYLVVADGDLISHPFLRRLARHSITVTQRSGGGGDHAFYWSSLPVKNSCQLIDEKLDIRGSGGIVVIAPSNHKSGKKYEFTCSLKDTTIQDVPDFLEKKLRIAIGNKNKATEKKNASVASSSKTSKLAKHWQSMNVAMIRHKICMGCKVPCGVRNATMHRLLSSDRARGVVTRASLKALGMKYLESFEDATSFKPELESIIKSVSRYPAYNNSFQKINELYLGWLAKHDHKIPQELSVLNDLDNKFFASLEKAESLENAMSLQEIAASRQAFLNSEGLTRFATYKSQLLAKKLLSLGFLKKRTRKGNLWMVKIGVQTASPEALNKASPSALPTEELKTIQKQKNENQKGLKDNDSIDCSSGKARVKLINSKSPSRQHFRDCLYVSNDCNKSMMILLPRLSEKQQDRGNELSILINSVQGKLKEFRPVPVACASVLLLDQIKQVRELELLDILWRGKKSCGELDIKDMIDVPHHDVEHPLKFKKVKKSYEWSRSQFVYRHARRIQHFQMG